ncbi:MAG: molybdopterin-binding protein, partial [Acutalibacteraceae bacterium]|nr:molybdopterin-binding protein [Acutalibacteraceae bacterium]
MSTSAEIICVGSELLLGDITDTNSQYLSRELAAMGIDVHYRAAVGDNAHRLCEVFKIAFSRADVIILTGGLGPTEDDITVKTVCGCLNIPLVLDNEALRRMKAYFERINREFTDNNISQA